MVDGGEQRRGKREELLTCIDHHPFLGISTHFFFDKLHVCGVPGLCNIRAGSSATHLYFVSTLRSTELRIEHCARKKKFFSAMFRYHRNVFPLTCLTPSEVFFF